MGSFRWRAMLAPLIVRIRHPAPIRTYPPSRRRPTFDTLEDRTVPALFAPQLDLSSLNGGTGFALNGIADNDHAGSSVSQAGDVNGDGFGDLIVAAQPAATGGVVRGEAYVVFGHAGGFTAALDPNTLDGTKGFRIICIDKLRSVSAAGDVNGDGFDDLIVGVPDGDARGGVDADRGEAYVVFGHAGAFEPTLDLNRLDAKKDFRIDGSADRDHAGFSVSGAGDVNGDGFDDVVIGAPAAGAAGVNSVGAAYVVFGHAGAFAATLDLSGLDGTNGFLINGIAANDQAGFSVSGAGDVNGDGFDDVVIGSPFASGTYGTASVVFGHGGSFAATLNLSGLNGTNGFRFTGFARGDLAGFSVSGAGDVNGDGFDDLIVGSPLSFTGTGNSGLAYVILGQSAPFPSGLFSGTMFQITGSADQDRAGSSVSGAGDVNGDGFDDLIVGAYGVGEFQGAAYVVFGHGGAFATTLALSGLDGTNGFQINGIDLADYAGRSVSGAGDVNGDGFADLIVGADGADAGGALLANRGQGYVIFGRGRLIAAGADKGGAPLVNVFKAGGQFRQGILAYPLGFAGGVRVAVGDVTGDGQADIVTAPGAGIVTEIKVFDGRTGALVGSPFKPFGATFKSGAFVAVGDVDPGHAGNELVVSPGKAAKKLFVKDLNGVTLSSFFAFGKTYTGGVRVATGDVAGGPEDEIIAVRQTSSSQVRVFTNTGTKLTTINAFAGAGAYVSAGNVDGAGKAEIIVGAGQNGQVSIFTGAGAPVQTFTAFTGYTGSVRVATVERFGQVVIVAAPGPAAVPDVKLFDQFGVPPLVNPTFPVFGLPFVGGVFLGGG